MTCAKCDLHTQLLAAFPGYFRALPTLEAAASFAKDYNKSAEVMSLDANDYLTGKRVCKLLKKWKLGGDAARLARGCDCGAMQTIWCELKEKQSADLSNNDKDSASERGARKDGGHLERKARYRAKLVELKIQKKAQALLNFRQVCFARLVTRAFCFLRCSSIKANKYSLLLL